MKTQMNKSSAKRIVVILCLSLALLVALGAFSFAWIRNYVDVDSVKVEAGKMLYNFKLYRVQNGVVTPITFFDTNNAGDGAAAESEARLEKFINDEDAIINVDNGEEVFFVIEKYDDSIDFDVALSFDNDGLPENFEYIGQMSYAMEDDSDALNGISTQAALETYLKSPGQNGADTDNLGTIWNTVQKTSLSGDQKYACIRMKLSKNSGVSADLEGVSFPFRVGFCVAQKGALPDYMQVDKFYVDDIASLEAAMTSYGYGDEIYITQNLTYTGDLVFTRPCTVTLLRSTLTLKGNLVFSYMYGGNFALNTASDGHIRIEKNNGAGGNFQIDLPDTTIELSGANNGAEGKADIYIEGSFTANASKNEGKGLLFRGARICNIEVEGGEYTYTQELKPILINGSTRISVSNRTQLGAIAVNFYCRKLIVENNGYIEKIDLSSMTQDVTLLSSPCILIDNAGTLGDSVILLPSWSVKYNKNDVASAEDNTQIIANKGSGTMKAITPNNTFSESASVINSGKYFFSTGNKLSDGYRDDIEYSLRTQFVETVNGEKTKIIVHYEAPSHIVLNEAEYSELSALSTLQSYVEYYAAKGDIASAAALTDVTVICYGDKALTNDDYNFIRTMIALTDLDLSAAESQNKTVPDNALNGLSALKNVKMSESDIQWGKYIFTGTAVDEIRLPQSLTKLDNPLDTWGRVNKQAVLDGIKYVRTSITVVDGMWANSFATQYIFTPDQYTYEAYRNLHTSNNTDWHSKIFIDNGAIRYGEYFLRYDADTVDTNPTCEFVVFTGGGAAWTEEAYNNYTFDFQRINIDGKVYTISSYDPYALYDKLKYEEALDIVIKSDVKTIGQYAFACSSSTNTTKGIRSVVIEGNPDIMGYVFFNNDALVSFRAEDLTTLKGGYNLARNDVLKTVYMPKLGVVEGSGDLNRCPNIETVDISVVERNDTNKDFYSADTTANYDKYSYARFYIHTENAKDVSNYSSALAADHRFVFVKESYADLYKITSTYTGVTDMGENELDALIEADVDGNERSEGEELAYYYVLDGNEAHLVACLLDKIDKTNQDYTTISSFNGGAYPVTQIGSASYHFTSIIAKSIKICDGIEELGSYAFDAEKEAFKKYCITLDLNDVEKAGKYAFYYVDMVRAIGDKLEEVGENTFSYNQNLIVANLPNLSRSRPAGTTATVPKVFVGCKKLRISYTSASEDIAYDSILSRKYSYIRFINSSTSGMEINIPNVNAVINGTAIPNQKTFSNNHVNVDSTFSRIYMSDYYNYSVNLNGMSVDIKLPGYIYYKEDNGELTLFAASPDLKLYGDYGSDEKNYITPNYIYSTFNSEYTSKDNGNLDKLKVTKIGRYAYGAVNIVGLESFTVAENIKILDVGALSGSAYDDVNGGSIVVLSEVNCLNLLNVTEIGEMACYKGAMIFLKTPMLKKIGDMAFADCSNLETVYLPSYEIAEGTYTFRYCTKLKKITFGKNANSLVNNMFYNNTSLSEITILNENQVVTVGTQLLDTTYASNVIVRVHAGIYDQYLSTYASGFGRIPVDNFRYYGEATQVGDLTYYWNIIDFTAKIAYIDYVEGTLPTTLTLPASFTLDSDTYTVVSVSPSAMAALSGVSTVVLPDSMEYLSFSTADLADTVSALQISSANTKFKTVNGVLYSKNGKTLLVYPKAKEDTAFTVDASVTEIFGEAFYGTKKLNTLTISGTVIINDRAFAASGISTIKFTSSSASTFAGRDIFVDANVMLKISVPSASLAAYKANVLVDYSILDRFIGA